MNIQPNTPPVVSSTTQTQPESLEQSAHAQMDVFVQDVAETFKEATHGIHDAFEKLHIKKPVVHQASQITKALAQAPAAAQPAPATEPVPVYLYKADAEATFAHLPASVPVVKDGLKAIRNELQKLVANNGGYGTMAKDAVEIIEGAIKNPAAEAAIVLSDVAKILAQMIQDMATPAAPAQPAEAAPAPAPAEAAPADA